MANNDYIKVCGKRIGALNHALAEKYKELNGISLSNKDLCKKIIEEYIIGEKIRGIPELNKAETFCETRYFNTITECIEAYLRNDVMSKLGIDIAGKEE